MDTTCGLLFVLFYGMFVFVCEACSRRVRSNLFRRDVMPVRQSRADVGFAKWCVVAWPTK